MGCGLRCCSAAWACTLLFDLPAVACKKVSAACDERQRVGAEVVVCDAELSDAAAVTGDFDLCDLLRDQPGVECVALKALGPAGAGGPTYQRDDFDVELLAGSEVYISVLV